MKGTNDWRQHLNELVNARLDAIHVVEPARNTHYLQRGTTHRRAGLKLKEGACQVWSPAGLPSWR
jgi:hypothetical protein